MKNSEDLTNKFISTCRSLSELSLEIGPSGNLSFRCDNDLIITPSGVTFCDISESCLSKVNLENPLVFEKLKPSSDILVHSNIYKARKDIKAILHTHSHHITLAAMLGLDIPVLNTMHADYFGKPIQYVPFSNHRKNGFGNIESFNEGEVFLLGKHGGLIIFTEIDAEKIVNSIRAFDEICRLYCEYIMLNVEVDAMPGEDSDSMREYYRDSYGNKNI